MGSTRMSLIRALCALVVGGMVLSAGALTANAADGPVKADISVQPIEGLSNDFIGGMDVSSMLSEEESGVVFKNAQGQPEDLFQLLKESGVNTVRLRVWNDPFNAAGQGYGGGNVDVNRAVTMGKRATAAGLNVLVDFQYSDFWADPGKQQAPKAWAAFAGDAAKTADAVYDYTKSSLETFKAAGVNVTMVQVGNETTNGIAGVSGWANMAQVFNAGSKAVREELPQAKVVLHFTNPEQAGHYADIAKQLNDNKVDYDVFASSYYPYWHGTTDNLTAVLKQIASTYKKQVMVAETQWPYTLKDGDGWENTVPGSLSSSDLSTYDISPQGQADEIRAVAQAVNNVGDNNGDGQNDGLGVFYWEPAWVPVGTGGKDNADLAALWNKYGAGWATQAAAEYDPADAGTYWGGDAVDNQALFDFSGKALPSLPIFSYLHTGAYTDHIFQAIQPVSISALDTDSTDDIVAKLPSSVTATYSDKVDEQEPVTWDTSPLKWIRGVGSYTVTGTTDQGHTATATITVTATNYLTGDGSFEDASQDSAWTISGTAGAASIQDDTSNAFDGTRDLHFWYGSAFSFAAERTFTGITPGAYTLSVGAEGIDQATVSATATADGQTASGQATLTGWAKRNDITINNVIIGADGSLSLSLGGTFNAGDWGTFDDIKLVKATASKPDTTALDDVLAKAEAINRDDYTTSSLAQLDQAVAAATVLEQGSAYTADDVAQVTSLVTDALNGLVKNEKVITSIAVSPAKVKYQVGDSIAPADLTVTGQYAEGAGSVVLTPGQYTLAYDFTKTSTRAKVTVSLAANPAVSTAYTVQVTAQTPQPGTTTAPVYRLYNTSTGEHFYTVSAAERDKDIQAGWRSEGVGWTAPTSGTPVYRLYNPRAKGGDHYYTKNKAEADKLVQAGWKRDNGGKPVFYSGGSVKVYVAYNPNARSGAHNYTKNQAEQDGLLKAGWKYGATAWYAIK